MLTLLQINDAFRINRPALSIKDVRQRVADGWAPEFGVIVLSRPSDGLLTEDDRDFIWNALGVPAFNHLVDEDGRVLARECDAHDGLHVEAPLPSVYRDRVISEACPCGRPGDRLMTDAII